RDLFGCHSLQKAGIGDLGAGQRVTFLNGQHSAAVKRIDISCEIAVVEFKYEMARQADAEYRHVQAPRDLHVHDREGDRDAGPALKHLVQATVPGVEKIGFVAVEAQLAEQVAAGFFDEIASVVEVAKAIPE